MEPKPYEAPKTDAPLVQTQSAAKTDQNQLGALVVPTLLGCLAGAALLFPITRGPGNPFGHYIGAGIGGLAGLIIGFIIRATW